MLVPVIRDADRKGIRELAKELGELAEKAATGKLTLEMAGGRIAITNLRQGLAARPFRPSSIIPRWRSWVCRDPPGNPWSEIIKSNPG